MKFKSYKQRNVITTTPDNIANQLITIYSGQGVAENLTEHGEVLLDTIAHSSLDNFSADTQGIINALYYLNYRLEAVRKTISFWDAYQIRETISDREKMLGQLANLPSNSAIVSNLRIPFKWLNSLQQEEIVYRGDLFIKDYQGNIHLIHGTSQGSYKPATQWVPTTQGGSTYALEYTYTENPQSPITTYLTMTGQPTGYNASFTLGANDDQSIVKIGTIKPVVKYYYIENGAQELIIFDRAYSVDNNNITVWNQSDIEVLCEVK